MKENESFALDYFRFSRIENPDFLIGEQLQYFSPKVRDCEEVVLEAVSRDENAFQFASKRLKNDRSFLKVLIKAKGGVILKAKPDFLKDEELVIQAFRHKRDVYPRVDSTLKSSSDFKVRALDANGLILEYLSDSEKDDRATVLRAVNQRGMALGFASENQRSNLDVVKAAVSSDPLAIQFALNDLKKNPEILRIFEEGLKKNPVALEFAQDELKSNRDLVLQLVTLDGRAFHFASELLRDDLEIALRAAKTDLTSYSSVSERLKADKSYVLALLESAYTLIDQDKCGIQDIFSQHIPHPSLRGEKEVLLALIKINAIFFLRTEGSGWNDRAFLMEAASVNGLAFRHFPESARDDEEIAILASEQNELSIEYISDRLRNDKKFRERIIR